ncbi:hypothetical protein Tco_0445805 [Tanacetum coccineum]
MALDLGSTRCFGVASMKEKSTAHVDVSTAKKQQMEEGYCIRFGMKEKQYVDAADLHNSLLLLKMIKEKFVLSMSLVLMSLKINIAKGKIVGNYRFDETKETSNETKGSKSSLKNSTRCRRNMKILEDLLKKIKITEDIP